VSPFNFIIFVVMTKVGRNVYKRERQYGYHTYLNVWGDGDYSTGVLYLLYPLKLSGHYMYRTSVTICTAQRSLYVPHSGHYMYRTAVTIYIAQRSLYVPHSGHYMYRTAVTICTTQRSLYVPHSSHYMYRTAVNICTTQRSLYVPHSGHYMYRTAVTLCTTSLTFNNSTFCPHSCIYLFCVDLRTNSDYFPIQH